MSRTTRRNRKPRKHARRATYGRVLPVVPAESHDGRQQEHMDRERTFERRVHSVNGNGSAALRSSAAKNRRPNPERKDG